jgi:hypothetical protein
MVFMLFLLGRALDVVDETELQRTCHRLDEPESAVFATNRGHAAAAMTCMRRVIYD